MEADGAPEINTRAVDNLAVAESNRATLSVESLRAYLIERRRAVITELESLNRLLKI